MASAAFPENPSRFPALAALGLVLLSGCVIDQAIPDPGRCARVDDGDRDWGDFGIGSCLAGPVDLRFVDDPDDPTRQLLLMVNTNRERNFRTGSLLSLDWNDVDLSVEQQPVHAVASGSVALPGLLSGFDLADDLALVATRVAIFEESEERDHVLLVDLRDPTQPVAASDSLDSVDDFPSLEVGLGLTDVKTFAGGERAMVLSSRTSEMFFLDLTDSPPTILDAYGQPAVGLPSFDDADASGSLPQMQRLAVNAAADPVGARYTLRFVDGLRDLWMADEDGLSIRAFETNDDRNFQIFQGGVDLTADESGTGLDLTVHAAAEFSTTDADGNIVRTMLFEGRDDAGVGRISTLR